MVFILAAILFGSYFLNLKVILFLFIIGICYYLYIRHRCNYFSTINLPQPPVSSYFLGNLAELEKDGKNAEKLKEWHGKYGKTFGIMEGAQKVIISSDPYLLNEVFVKQFSTFQSRKLHASFVLDQKNDSRVNLFLSEGSRWKRLRGLITSSLTVKQIKQIDPIVKEASHELMEDLRLKVQKNNGEFNVMPSLLDASFAVIARLALGIHEKFGESAFLSQILEALDVGETKKSWMKSFLAGTYEFRKVTNYIQFISFLTTLSAILKLRGRVEKMITKRESETPEEKANRQQDFIDFLKESQEEIGNVCDSDLSGKAPKKLTKEELIGTAQMFLIAGGDTTSNMTGYCLYELAKHPEYQEMIVQEINDFINDEEDITYTAIQDLDVLDRFIKEVSRFHPIGFPVLARRAINAATLPHPNGGTMNIEAGVCVHVNAMILHMDENVWGSNAKEFNPDRFLPENSKNRHPLALFTFGAGPRICPGKKLAVYEVKVFLIYLLREFKIELCKTTELKEVTRSLLCPESMNLKLVPRNLS